MSGVLMAAPFTGLITIQSRPNFISSRRAGWRTEGFTCEYLDKQRIGNAVSEAWRSDVVFISRRGNGGNNTGGAPDLTYLTTAEGFGIELFPPPKNMATKKGACSAFLKRWAPPALWFHKQQTSLSRHKKKFARESLSWILCHESVSALKFRCLTSESNEIVIRKFPKG